MNRVAPETIDLLFESFRASMGVNAAARRTGCAKNTVAKYLRLFEAWEQTTVHCLCGKPRHVGWCKAQENAERVEAFCGCGKPLRHRGWCSIRFARSPARQAVMARLHGRPVLARPPKLARPPERPIVAYRMPELDDRQRRELATARMRKLKVAKRKPISRAELQSLIANAYLPIKRLRPGAHLGYRPSWLGE